MSGKNTNLSSVITVKEAIAWLQKCHPDAILRIAKPNDDFSVSIEFIEEAIDFNEVHFCDSKPDWNVNEDWQTEVIFQDGNFAQVKVSQK